MALMASLTQAASTYNLVDTFNSTNFFQEFDFFSQPDPTNGFVQYAHAAIASSHRLAGYSQGGIYLGVDYANITTKGRPSVRVTSKKAYTKGLFIADIAHMPAGPTDADSCGLWPAFWMFGPNWPNSGEIDIIEGVNTQSVNSITLHTGPGCSMSTGNTSGTASPLLDCQGFEGCTYPSDDDDVNNNNNKPTTTTSSNYGAGFNAISGGVYAVEWTDAAIQVWFFPRNSAQCQRLQQGGSDSASAPSPETFGPPLAAFYGGAACSIPAHFAQHNLVFDTTFCGDWAGRVWAKDATCAALAARCEDYVGANPEAYVQAYWLVNEIRVYQVA
ncbi:glycoside hydrolase family 16 protein [Canariomyces notabilis]|uniref:Glycoside hydrolase family 16 protein n=1 Tax=Canariomyces notabilis TaxID=2074819 RepID=A0AAN6QQG4_9PEZI|nr:glycoside hydrolase family 16 protein [Canariomyces arenarius]